jgi:hypothetical protein
MGDIDLVVSRPEDRTDIFERANHTRNGWITKENFYIYTLRDKAGSILSKGSKRAWCMMDHSRFNCNCQGISIGDHDQYGTQEHCQFLLIDDLLDREYVFEAPINPSKILEEDNYDDKVTKLLKIQGQIVEITIDENIK